MYAKVLECLEIGEKQWMVELSIDQQGLKANTILSSQSNNNRWEVDYRVVYAQFRNIHKKFPFERLKVIRLEIPEGDLEKLKLDLCEREEQGIFQYIINGTSRNLAPKKGDVLLCAGY